MRIARAAKVAAAAILSFGVVRGSDSPFAPNRSGSAVPDSWIAAVRSGDDVRCDALRARIEEIRAAQIGIRGVRKPVKAVKIQELCFVDFDGSAALADAVRREPHVEYVAEDLQIRFASAGYGSNSTADDGDFDGDLVSLDDALDPVSWGLNRLDQPNLPLSRGIPFGADYSGAGVNIFVVDTGINAGHQDFDGRAVHGQNFVEMDGEDQNGHGTHCAGTAAGATFGVARGATVIGVKALSGSGSGSIKSVIDALAWIVSKQKELGGDKPGVISLSLGGDYSSALHDAVLDAGKSMIVIVAAGNDSDDACRFSPSSAGGSGLTTGVVSVGSMALSGGEDARSPFSNYGSCVDIFAPGSDILSAWVGSRTASAIESGTSMAAPHVAGIAAMMLEKNSFDRALALRDLFSSAVPGRIASVGQGSPNLLAQVPLGRSGPPTPQPTRPPTLAPSQVCVDDYCASYKPSLFGPHWDDDSITYGRLAEPAKTGDAEGCTPLPPRTYAANQIVLVKRGRCTFFEKVKIAEDGGAKAVIFYMNAPGEVFEPKSYDWRSVAIPSLMVDYTAGQILTREIPACVGVGSPSFAKVRKVGRGRKRSLRQRPHDM